MPSAFKTRPIPPPAHLLPSTNSPCKPPGSARPNLGGGTAPQSAPWTPRPGMSCGSTPNFAFLCVSFTYPYLTDLFVSFFNSPGIYQSFPYSTHRAPTPTTSSAHLALFSPGGHRLDPTNHRLPCYVLPQSAWFLTLPTALGVGFATLPPRAYDGRGLVFNFTPTPPNRTTTSPVTTTRTRPDPCGPVPAGPVIGVHRSPYDPTPGRLVVRAATLTCPGPG